MSTFQIADAAYVTDGLAVGGDLDGVDERYARQQLDDLIAGGITHVLDLRSEADDEEFLRSAAPTVRYHHLGIDDAGQTIPPDWFDEAVAWIEAALADSRAGVLVHCHLGMNRSPSLVFAYLLSSGFGVIDALAVVRTARPVATLAYAADALAWHHATRGATQTERRRDRKALDAWLAAHPLDEAALIGCLRAVRDQRSLGEQLLKWCDAVETSEEWAGGRCWLFQMDRRYADRCARDFFDGETTWELPIDRHRDEVDAGDLVLLWRMGPGETAGVFGLGFVEDPEIDTTRLTDWADPDSHVVPSAGLEAGLLRVSDEILVRRTELKVHPEFGAGKFELFDMANRHNLFAVELAQVRRMALVMLALASALHL